MAFTLSPSPWLTFVDGNGNPYAGAKLFVYQAGTTIKADTASDIAGTPNTNPVILDSAGRATVFLAAGQSYKFVLAPATDTDPPVSPIKTQDNIATVPSQTVDLDVTGVAGEAIAALDVCYLSDGTGGKTAGRWYKADADFTYASSNAATVGFATAAISSGATGTFRLGGKLSGFVGLTTGAPYYVSATAGAITSTTPTNARFVGTADTTASLVISGTQLERVIAIVTKTANYTAVISDDLIIGTGTWTLSLYAASGNAGRQLLLKNAGTGIITLDGNGSETVDGTGTVAVFPGEYVVLTADGTSNWASSLPVVRHLDQLTTPVTFTNNATENNLYSFSVPPFTLGTIKCLRFRAFLVVVTDAGGARSVNIRVKFGGTTILSGNVTFTANTTHFCEIDIAIFASGATNAQRAVATIVAASTGGGSAWAAINATPTVAGGNTSIAIDTTAAQVFGVTAQMDSAQVGYTTTLENGVLRLE